jgi:hypothetical protein
MSVITSNPYPSREVAEHVAGQLVQKGIPMNNIVIRDETPAIGLNLGAGVPLEAVNAIVAEHDTEPTYEATAGGYVVEVETAGDALNEQVTHEVFGDR